MKFSERMGFVEVRSLIQREDMSEELRNSLWNVLDQAVWSSSGFMYVQSGYPGIRKYSRALWFHHFKLPMDTIPDGSDRVLEIIRDHFFGCEWHQVYDFIEFTLQNPPSDRRTGIPMMINFVLERELAGFRVIENQIVPITDENEISAISEAIKDSPFAGARAHLRQALSHFSSRESPDYRNSIKESISAVESAAKELTNNEHATLGDALKQLEKSGEVHGALKTSFSALYGYTSDAGGIRHAMLEEPNLTITDAKYFLVACSAFVNYLAERRASAAY